MNSHKKTHNNIKETVNEYELQTRVSYEII